MADQENPSRRKFVRRFLLAATLAPIVTVSQAADLPLLSPTDEAAKKVKYTEDAKTAAGATKDNMCSNCALYEGTYGAPQGPCQLFPGKHVKATGWCSAWAPQI